MRSPTALVSRRPMALAVMAALLVMASIFGACSEMAPAPPDTDALVTEALAATATAEAAMQSAINESVRGTATAEAAVQSSIDESVRATVVAQALTSTPPPTSTRTVPTPTGRPTAAPTATALPIATPSQDLATVVARVRPSVVRVSTTHGTGSGVIIEVDSAGRATVVTNQHVVEGATSATVLVNDSEDYRGAIQGSDALKDLAILTICCSTTFVAVPFSAREELPAGTTVFAMGYPLGFSQATITLGTVSANWSDDVGGRRLIQTDAPINPGNSSGPLFALDGAVAGIVTSRIDETTSGRSVEGLGFAIASATVRSSLPALQRGNNIYVSPTPWPTPVLGSRSISGKPLDPDAVFGGVLQAAATGDGPTYSNWEEAAGIPDDAIQPLYNMLIQPRTWGTLDDYGNYAFFELKPDLAEEWRVSSDGKQYTFRIRRNVEWSDGTPITCRDVKWSYDTIRTGQGLRRSPRAVHFKSIVEINCPDDLTVVFTLEYPKPAMLEVIAQPYNVIRPAHIYKTMLETVGNLDEMRSTLPTVTSGPFIPTQYIPGERYRFERNAEYWDAPFPYLDGIDLNILASSAQVSAMRAGRLDVGAKQGWDRGRADTLLRECRPDVCSFWPRLIASSFSPAIMPHHDRQPWNNPLVKQAIALSIDNHKYIDVVTLGYAAAPTGCGFFPNSEWAMPQDRCSALPGMADIFGETAVARFAASNADKARARELLAEAGFGPGELGVTVRFWSVIADNVPPIIEDLRAIGINAEAEIISTALAYDAWINGDFDIGVHSFWIAGLDPDVTMYEHFYTGSDRNYNRYSNVKFDNLVDRMSRTLDQAEHKELAWQAMELALTEVAKVVVAHGAYIPTFSARVRGLMPAVNYLAGYGPQARYDHVWLAE